MVLPVTPDLDVETGESGHPGHHDAITALLDAVRTALGSGLPEQITAEAVASLTALLASGRLSAAALSATFDRILPRVMEDDFAGVANGALSGRTPLTGPAWAVTGAVPPTITSAAISSIDVGYAWANIARTGIGRLLLATIKYAAAGGGVTIATSADATLTLDNLVHLQTEPDGFNLTLRADGGTFDACITADWPRAIEVGESVVIGLMVVGDTVTVIGPDGSAWSRTDPRLELIDGPTVMFEPLGTGAAISGQVTDLQVIDLDGREPWSFLAGAAAGRDGFDRMVGNPNSQWQVAIGIDPTTACSAISFGATEILTRITTAISISGTSLVTADPIPNGSTIVLGVGSDGEALTISGGPTGTGPYTHTIGAATKAHAIGAAVVAAPPATSRFVIFYNPVAQTLNIPLAVIGTIFVNDNVVLTTGTGTKIGTATTQKLGFWNATPVVQPAANADTSGAVLADLETEVNQLKALLRTLGLMAA